VNTELPASTSADRRCNSASHASPVSSGAGGSDAANNASANAKRSILSVKSGKMPQGGKRLTADEIGLLEDWVTGGRRP
jgi:hypothetical protein